MTSPTSPPRSLRFGYLTVFQQQNAGFFGGYLLVCGAGRPLEFHCTAPIRPSRAQEILYGRTLPSYLLGDQIGQTLVKTAKLTPHLLLTDSDGLECLSPEIGFPLVRISAAGAPIPAGTNSHDPLIVRGHTLQFPPDGPADHGQISQLLEHLSTEIEISEPFERIRLAIDEAQRISGTRATSEHACPDARAA